MIAELRAQTKFCSYVWVARSLVIFSRTFGRFVLIEILLHAYEHFLIMVHIFQTNIDE